MVTIGSDARLLASAAKNIVSEARKIIDGVPSSVNAKKRDSSVGY